MKEFLAFELLDDSLKKALPPACPPSGDTKMASNPHVGIVYSMVEGDVPFCKRFYDTKCCRLERRSFKEQLAFLCS